MDDCDQGARYADFFLRQSLAKARSNKPAGKALTNCIECGEPIPEARRKAMPGCLRCVDCETLFEKEV